MVGLLWLLVWLLCGWVSWLVDAINIHRLWAVWPLWVHLLLGPLALFRSMIH